MYNNFERDNIQQEKIIEVIEDKKDKKKGKRKTIKLLTGALVVGMLAGVGFEGVHYATDRIWQSQVEKETEKENGMVASSTSSINTEGDVSTLVENVMPAIVSIETTVQQTVNNFWGGTYSGESSGSGSGIIIGENDTELLVVTNNHVITGENAIVKVIFHDESTVDATVKGADASSDLAVLAIDKDSLTNETKNNIKIATLGDSTKTKVGEVAVAIGNALGSGQSVTVGYISAKDRKVALEDYSMALLQTDAAINPGNSGGALLNAAGEVIGINSVKYSSEEVEGMGYAIPISDAIPIINELMNREQLDISEQGYLGIRGQDVTESTGGFNMPEGIYVGEVTEGSPAEKGGIVAGNIICKINDKKVTTMESLQDTLTYTKAGTTVNITVKELENGEYVEKTLEVTLGSKSEISDSTTTESEQQIEDNQQSKQFRNPFGR
ncbi:MAG: PDZ domain-containing protein [Lachnospiraceae bacterium]|nr:PDZ domain-containing protein [Lachnospiraceae bacterium]